MWDNYFGLCPCSIIPISKNQIALHFSKEEHDSGCRLLTLPVCEVPAFIRMDIPENGGVYGGGKVKDVGAVSPLMGGEN